MNELEEGAGFNETVLCKLGADEKVRQDFWQWSIKHTLLVNELLIQVSQHKDFEQWKNSGTITKKAVVELGKPFKDPEREQFIELPYRFHTSATLLVFYIYQSWLKLHQKHSYKLQGKKKWLAVLDNDLEVAKHTDFSPQMIQTQASEILSQASAQHEKSQQKRKKKSSKKSGETSKSHLAIMTILFDRHEQSQDLLERRAIAHLLKNGCQVNDAEEDLEALKLRLEKKRIQIARLEKQLERRLPDGRDPTGERFASNLAQAIAFADHLTFVPAKFWINWYQVLQRNPNDESDLVIPFLGYVYHQQAGDAGFDAWEQGDSERAALVSTLYETLPYPILFGSAGDVYWSLKQVDPNPGTTRQKQQSHRTPKRRRKPKHKQKVQERLCVRFKGEELKNHHFGVYCDRRQLPVFKQFLTDREVQKQRKDTEKFMGGIFTLRSARLVWKEDTERLQRKRASTTSLLWLKFLFAMQREETVTDKELDSWIISFLCINTIFPWQSHRLYLHCTIDSRLLTAEGTKEVIAQKTAATQQYLEQFKPETATPKPQAVERVEEERQTPQARGGTTVKKKETTLARSKNPPPARPSRLLYKGRSDIAAVVVVSRFAIVAVAIVNTQTQEILEFQKIKDLLTEHRSDVLEERLKKHQGMLKGGRSLEQLQLQQYRLVKRWRKHRKKNLTQRQEEQKRGLYKRSNQESNLAQYLNRLLAKRIVQLCQTYQVGMIVLPELGNIGENFECEIQAKARQKFPGDNVQLQKQYLKELRMRMHRWNYKNLLHAIRQYATPARIPVTTRWQPKEGALRDKAAVMARAVPPGVP
ncbi:hypothetical protein C7B76_02030 [filamentous cyanobacterium CCP2]|nr:hypothetical protein C7B76_02030 [filamentous cyanobacterium CCP2]